MVNKPDWFYNQSAVIPYRLAAGKIEILLITSRKRKRWIIPKGIIEPQDSPAESAVKEAWEEAGITGRIFSPSVGVYEYQKWGGTCHVRVFVFEVEQIFESWPESFRAREWVSVAEAARRVDERELKQIILTVSDSIRTIKP
jgi:phosphohistidine phosphatase